MHPDCLFNCGHSWTLLHLNYCVFSVHHLALSLLIFWSCPFSSVPQVWSTVRALRTAARCALWSISRQCAGTPSAHWPALCSQASDYTQDRYYLNKTQTQVFKLHTFFSVLTMYPSFLNYIVSFNTLMLVFIFPSSQNSTDWCTYNLQRRRANTSTNTIDRRTPCRKVWHKRNIQYTQMQWMQGVFGPLTCFFLASQKLHQTLIPKRRRKRGTTILTARKRRKTRKRRR